MRDFKQIEWDEELADSCRQLVRLAIREDLDRGEDWTTVALVPEDALASADIVARNPGVIAGLRAAEIVIEQMDSRLTLTLHASDGADVDRDCRVATLSGPARSLLTAERPVLNFVGHLSGVATNTRQYVDQVAGTNARIYDTRKTTPGWRRLEKYAVRCGGGKNHRTGLFDAILIKDNHLAFGSHASPGTQFTPGEAVRQARAFVGNFPVPDGICEGIVEIEVDSIDQLLEVLTVQPDIVLLDNMNCAALQACVAIRNKNAPQVQLEASGGVNLQTVRAIAETGVDRISVGALTHSAKWFDVGLDWHENSQLIS
jgi:nicotinate-nucleotide pyrophosphorylase (carboxylating)